MRSLKEIANEYRVSTKTMSKYIRSITDPILDNLQQSKRIILVTPKEYLAIQNALGTP